MQNITNFIKFAAVIGLAFGVSPGFASPVEVTGAGPSKRPSYEQYTDSYRIPFAHLTDFRNLEVLQVRASINGGQTEDFTVDTGSTGIVVGKADVPYVDPAAPEGRVKYSSSGLVLHGHWMRATVTYPESSGMGCRRAQAVVPVLVVEWEECSGTGVNSSTCVVEANPHPHMMGIGFGRGDAAHPERNPFINLKEMTAGSMRRGYVITQKGFDLGLTAQNTAGGFVFQQLVQRVGGEDNDGTLKDWQNAPGSFQVGSIQSAAGEVLIDSGLTNMILDLPGGPTNGDVAAGTLVTVHLLGGQVNYQFKVGDYANPYTPSNVGWATPTHGTYVNTGLRALAELDYLFDGAEGYLALKSAK